MAEEGGIAAILISLVCFICFHTSSPGEVSFAAEGKLVLPNALVKKPSHLYIQRSRRNQVNTQMAQELHLPQLPSRLVGNSTSTTWCIVKSSTSQEKLDDIIQYCCTQPKVDCKVIQEGGICYLPPNKISDASVVMNIYYNLNGKNSFNCDFRGSGLIVTHDPSVGKCIYQA